MTVDQFLQSVSKNDHVTFVLFKAKWCKACGPIGSLFNTTAEENNDNTLHFMVVDIDKEQAVAEHCMITKLPTLQVWSQKVLLDDTVPKSPKEMSTVFNRFAFEEDMTVITEEQDF